MIEEVIENVKEIDENNDLFGTYTKAKSILDFIELKENEKLLSENNLIAIYGEWGIGKSCLMKTIQENLDKERYDTCWFDTWKYEHDTNLAYSLLKFIDNGNFIRKLEKSTTIGLKTVFGLMKSFASGIQINTKATSLNLNDMITCAQEEDKKIEDYIRNEDCLWEKVNKFEEEFSKIKPQNDKKIIVFLDDLDRCESENIITLISSIKLLLSLNKNIIFIIGIDKKAVTLALKNKYNNDCNKADEYLEKIFPLNFEITSKIQNDNLLNYIEKVMDLDKKRAQFVLDFFNEINFNNSRHLKKVLRKYYLMKNYLKTKIDLNNDFCIVLVLYMIILNTFYEDEYRVLLEKNKEKIYNQIVLNWKSRDGSSHSCAFLKYSKVMQRTKTDIFDFVVRFSSFNYSSNNINCMSSMESSVYIDYDVWKSDFPDNICSEFIDFILNNFDCLTSFINNNKIDKDKLYSYISIIDDIM